MIGFKPATARTPDGLASKFMEQQEKPVAPLIYDEFAI